MKLLRNFYRLYLHQLKEKIFNFSLGLRKSTGTDGKKRRWNEVEVQTTGIYLYV